MQLRRQFVAEQICSNIKSCIFFEILEVRSISNLRSYKLTLIICEEEHYIRDLNDCDIRKLIGSIKYLVFIIAFATNKDDRTSATNHKMGLP